MKWKTAAGLALALAGWSRFSKDAEEEKPPEYVTVGQPSDPCPPGKIRVWGFAEQGFVCIPIKK